MYTHACCAADPALLEARADLCAVLIVPVRTPTLDLDVERMGLRWQGVSPGYWRLGGGLFPLHLVEIDVVAEQEDDDLLRLFGHAEERTLEARRFWAEQIGFKEAEMAVQDLEGYDEVMQKLLENLSPEQRVAGLSPKQRMAGLSHEQILLALPDELLRLLPEDVIATLSKDTRTTAHARGAKKPRARRAKK